MDALKLRDAMGCECEYDDDDEKLTYKEMLIEIKHFYGIKEITPDELELHGIDDLRRIMVMYYTNDIYGVIDTLKIKSNNWRQLCRCSINNELSGYEKELIIYKICLLHKYFANPQELEKEFFDIEYQGKELSEEEHRIIKADMEYYLLCEEQNDEIKQKLMENLEWRERMYLMEACNDYEYADYLKFKRKYKMSQLLENDEFYFELCGKIESLADKRWQSDIYNDIYIEAEHLREAIEFATFKEEALKDWQENFKYNVMKRQQEICLARIAKKSEEQKLQDQQQKEWLEQMEEEIEEKEQWFAEHKQKQIDKEHNQKDKEEHKQRVAGRAEKIRDMIINMYLDFDQKNRVENLEEIQKRFAELENMEDSLFETSNKENALKIFSEAVLTIDDFAHMSSDKIEGLKRLMEYYKEVCDSEHEDYIDRKKFIIDKIKDYSNKSLMQMSNGNLNLISNIGADEVFIKLVNEIKFISRINKSIIDKIIILLDIYKELKGDQHEAVYGNRGEFGPDKDFEDDEFEKFVQENAEEIDKEFENNLEEFGDSKEDKELPSMNGVFTPIEDDEQKRIKLIREVLNFDGPEDEIQKYKQAYQDNSEITGSILFVKAIMKIDKFVTPKSYKTIEFLEDNVKNYIDIYKETCTLGDEKIILEKIKENVEFDIEFENGPIEELKEAYEIFEQLIEGIIETIESNGIGILVEFGEILGKYKDKMIYGDIFENILEEDDGDIDEQGNNTIELKRDIDRVYANNEKIYGFGGEIPQDEVKLMFNGTEDEINIDDPDRVCIDDEEYEEWLRKERGKTSEEEPDDENYNSLHRIYDKWQEQLARDKEEDK